MVAFFKRKVLRTAYSVYENGNEILSMRDINTDEKNSYDEFSEVDNLIFIHKVNKIFKQVDGLEYDEYDYIDDNKAELVFRRVTTDFPTWEEFLAYENEMKEKTGSNYITARL